MRLEDRGKNTWATITADMQRYVDADVRPWSMAFLKRLATAAYENPALLAIVVYRYGQWIYFRCRIPVVRQLLDIHYYFLFNWVRTRLGVEVHRTTAIDAGFRIDHFGAIIVNSQTIAGKGLTISTGVVIGNSPSGTPTFGDNVTISVGAKIIGGIYLGNNVFVGAQALVNKSFPDGAIVAGVPAKILKFQEGYAPPESDENIVLSGWQNFNPANPEEKIA